MKTLIKKLWAPRLLSQFAIPLAMTTINVIGQTQLGQSVASDYTCVQRGPDSKVWQTSESQTNQDGSIVTNQQSYIEIATGLCYSQNGQYVDSVEEVDAVANGAQAVQGQHQVWWAANANTPTGAVVLTTPDSKQLSSTVYGLAYYDTASGSNAAIAQIQNCFGTIAPPNQVVYASAFDSLNADILYTYRKAGMSQDIVLRQAPGAPHRYGLPDKTTILQVYTEFFNSPEPQATSVSDGNTEDDRILDFGQMQMGVGQTFFLNGQTPAQSAGTVSKQWVHVNGRTFLIESIPYSAISNQLQQLPQASNLKPGKASIRRTALLDSPPKSASSSQEKRPMQQAAIDKAKPRLVLDYVLLSSTSSLTLQGDTTYLVSGTVNVSSTLTIEGGTVVKYTNGSASSELSASNIVCPVSPYRPGVFTSMDDNSVGSKIPGATGSPNNNINATFLDISTSGNTNILRNLRMSYADFGIFGSAVSGASPSFTVWDCQFFKCSTACFFPYVYYSGANSAIPFNLYNVLFSQCPSALSTVNVNSAYFDISAENVTADQVNTFQGTGTGETPNVLNATNSIFTSVTNLTGTFVDCYTNTNSNAGIYQTVGGGSYYLIGGSTNQGVGTTNINANLLADLETKTTYPPATNLISYWITNNTTLYPGSRDNNGSTVDRGYHYDPLDYALVLSISNATVTVLPGTALAMMGSSNGILLSSGATFNCTGTATNPAYIVRYNTVQEQSTTNWESTNWVGSFQTPTTNGTPRSSANFIFTDWSVLGADGQLETFARDNSLITMRDCQFYGGTIFGSGPTMLVTNCLFQRVNTFLEDTNAVGAVSNTFYNNLFWFGEFGINHTAGGTNGTWTFCDNLFHEPQITNSTNYTIDVCTSNAFLTTNFGIIYPTNNSRILSGTVLYQAGPLGNFYYKGTDGGILTHAGSRSAAAAGLYHYTVTNNNIIEGTNMVSIGFHYVACDTNGVPLDSNEDGVPDYIEDANGDGIVDGGETNWALAVLSQPVGQVVCPGANVIFDIGYGGLTPITFQWMLNSTNISGATNTSLSLSDVTAAQAGTYSIVLSNAYGTVTSSNAVLTVIGIVSLAPTNNTNCSLVSSNATLQTWEIPESTNVAVTNLEILATLNPSFPSTNLPTCLSLDGVLTNAVYVSITGPAIYTVVCSLNSLAVTNIIWVTENGDIEGACSDYSTNLLGYWDFDGGSPWVGNYGQEPLQDYGLQNPASPWSNSLCIDTNILANLSYNYMETNGYGNIHCINGAVNFWFKPDWNGGTGPGNIARLLEIGDTNSSNGWWSLWADSTGSTLSFQSKSNGVLTTYFTNSIVSWNSNTWYYLALDYSQTGTSLYTNGVLAQSGTGMTNYPTINQRMAYGFSIGSDHTGTNQSRGCFDLFSTFSCPLSEPAILDGYESGLFSANGGSGVGYPDWSFYNWLNGINSTTNLMVFTPLK